MTENSRRRRRDRKLGPYDLLAVLPLLALVAFMGWQARLFFVADLQMLESRWLIVAWTTGLRPMTPASWMRAYDATQKALDTMPGDPNLRVQLGVLYQLAGRMPDEQRAPEQTNLFLRQAAGQYRTAVALRPGDGWAWSNLAELQQTVEPGSPAAWHAWREALRHAPLEDPVQTALLRTGFMAWAQAPADVKAWVNAFYEATPAQRQEIDDIATGWGASDWRGSTEQLSSR